MKIFKSSGPNIDPCGTPADIFVYSLKAGLQLGGGGGEASLPFFENQKKCPDFAKKDLDCVHP